ncbi:pacearchaeosortase [archaeon]|nr:pacearchaeosortase [archaeon]
MKWEDKKIKSILIRYLILALIAIPGLDIFYFLFLPLTKYPVYFGLKLFYSPVLLNNVIFIGSRSIEIIGACVAGSAYFFLLILNLSIPNIELKKRLKIILSSFSILLGINIIRIYLLSLMYLHGSSLFDITHKIFWYLGSTIFIVLIWFLNVWMFKIKEIPFYSDLKFMYKISSLKK